MSAESSAEALGAPKAMVWALSSALETVVAWVPLLATARAARLALPTARGLAVAWARQWALATATAKAGSMGVGLARVKAPELDQGEALATEQA